MHVLPLHRLVHLSPNTPTSKSTVHHNSANTFRLAHVLQKLFSLFLGISRPCTFSALPFPILVTGEQTGKAIVAGHLNGVPLEDLLGAAELQDADPEEDLSDRPNESDTTHAVHRFQWIDFHFSFRNRQSDPFHPSVHQSSTVRQSMRSSRAAL